MAAVIPISPPDWHPFEEKIFFICFAAVATKVFHQKENSPGTLELHRIILILHKTDVLSFVSNLP